jgi:hypothetical protein
MGYKTVKITLIRHARIDGLPALYGSLTNIGCLKEDLLQIEPLKPTFRTKLRI